uniref:Diacylglycerol kinase n=1 Tax=Strigamia maritima TaxID=126957 RepID=T1JHM2_STRMM
MQMATRGATSIGSKESNMRETKFDEKKAIQAEVLVATESGDQRSVRSAAIWNETAVNGDHLWVSTSASGDFCYVNEVECSKQGPRLKCAACKITAHTGCLSYVTEKFYCKPTFRDVGVRQYREHTIIHHHWVHRRNQKGKCKRCSKSFQSKLFSNKDIVALSCSWCKAAYHNKESCFSMQTMEEQCTLGIHSNIIVPPSWIVKLPRKGSFKSSLRKSPKKRSSSKRKSKKEASDKEHQRFFAIKPIPTPNAKPVIVFINPKSGGNQGSKLMQKFQWLLNPRQVFDLSQGGPQAGLELYKKVPNLRILACGGDGTVGWILSVLDEIGFVPPPPVAVLPLGTGNDLARALGWGGGYTDEPVSKILCNIEEGETIQLDRWDLKVEKNSTNIDPSVCEDGKDNLPLSVINNYFSLGADAYIALEFHEAREAHPEKFNSRLRNKMFYGQAGGKDLLQRKWKDLSEYVVLECDGKDITPKLKELKVHAILFLNIPSYGGGTHPWNSQNSGFEPQRTDDGLIEVIGLTTYQLPLLQAGGHGTCLAQCKHARLVTTRTIPMQVDGEPCKLAPSVIELTHLNQVNMMAKAKQIGSRPNTQQPLERLRLQVSRITMSDYENYHYDKERLRKASIPLGIIVVDQDTDLDHIRIHINRLQADISLSAHSNGWSQKLSSDWCFLDSCTAERFFRIDRAQEHLHYVTDISCEELYILDPDLLISERSSDALPSRPAIDPEERISEAASATLSKENETIHRTEAQSDDFLSSPQEKYSEDIIKAGRTGDLKLLKELHSMGFSLLSVDQFGMTSLHHAARHGFKDIVRYLIASAPPTILNMVDKDKQVFFILFTTALHTAAAYKRRTICCMLVAAGASLTIVDNQCMTSRQQALKAEDKELAAYLESKMLNNFLGLDRNSDSAIMKVPKGQSLEGKYVHF